MHSGDVDDEEVAVLVRAAASGDEEAGDRLAVLAGRDAARVGPELAGLLAAGVTWPSELYRAADDDVRRRLVELVDAGAGDQINELLFALAHAAGPIAEDAFRRWSVTAPPDADRLRAPLLDYALFGGWAVEPAGVRRLWGSAAFALVPGDERAAQEGGHCPWCHSRLWTALDVDTSDARVAAALEHSGWSGRLRVETCHFCACYATLFAEVAADGTSRLSELTQRPVRLPADAEEPPRITLAVGDRRESPFEASAWAEGGSTLGGCPDWIQNAEYARCPACGEWMDHVALLGGADLSEFGEGAYYVGVHARCGLAAVLYQQS